MRNYPVKENHNGSAVSEILRYRQTYKQTKIRNFIIRITYPYIPEIIHLSCFSCLYKNQGS